MPASATPFLRWAGGKRSLLPVISAAAVRDYGRYYEPFVGGGAVYFALGGDRPRIINDVNPELVLTYRSLRDDIDRLIAELDELAKDTSERAYKHVRGLDPLSLEPSRRAARFIYLNKLCFNGLYRENHSGRFNVPYGHLARPRVLDEPTLRAASSRLQGTEVRCGPFAEAVADAGEGDFVYLDPPYLPLSASSSFAAYAKGGFAERDHRQLAETIATLVARGAAVMLSNSDTARTREIYGGLGASWALYGVQVRRSIAAFGASRGRVGEVLGLSYPLERCAAPDAASEALGAPLV